MSSVEDTAFLRSVDLFSGLDDSTLSRLQTRLSKVTLQAGEILFNAGDTGNDLYIVRAGELAVFTQRSGNKTRKVATITSGQCVGEMGLFMSGTRQATVRAESDAELCKLDRAAFQALLEEAPRLKSVFGRIIESRLPKLRAVLMDLFGGLDDNVFRDIESCLTWRRLLRGEVLFREGDAGDALYLIVHGRVQINVRSSGSGETRVLGELGRGEWVGEMSLLDNLPRSATVSALRDSDLLGLTRAGFDTVLERYPKLLVPVVKSLSRRLRGANTRSYHSAIPPTSLSVAIVPLTPLPPYFVETLADQLARDGKVIVLSAAAFDEVHGPGASRIGASDPRSPHLSSWLAQLEEDHRYVLYTADGEPSEWTERCLRHADRIVFSMVFDPESMPDQIRRWHGLPPVQARREILFWHPHGHSTLPRHTARLLRELPAERHHHLRLGEVDDIARLGRFLTNRSIGLVLSGGGARGFAHIGAYQALREAGIPIDRVIGTSMGGFIGALIACQYDLEDIVRHVRRVLVDRPNGFGYTLPLLSLFQVRRSEARLREVFDGCDIEDAWLQLCCCATNLSSSRLMLLNEGPLWRACRATTAVPGLCPPVFHQGDILVDGAVLDNVPVDVASELEPGPLITCDVTKARALTVDPSLDVAPSLPRLLWERMKWIGTSNAMPNIGTILTRSLDCTSRFRQESNRRMATLYLEPPVGDFGLLDMERIETFIDIGYRYTADQLAHLDLSSILEYRNCPDDLPDI